MSKVLAIHALVQFGNTAANAEWLCRQLRSCAHLSPDLVVTPELVLTGHPMEATSLPWDAAETEAAIDLVARTADELGLAVLLGTLYARAPGTQPTNALILLHEGKRTLIFELAHCAAHTGAPQANAAALQSSFYRRAETAKRRRRIARRAVSASLICRQRWANSKRLSTAATR